MPSAVLAAGTVGNTVPDSQPALDVHVDWVTLRILTPDPGQAPDLVGLVGDTLRDVFEIIPGPHKIREHNCTYDWMAVSAKGIRAYWFNPGNGLSSWGRVSSLRLEFSGAVCQSVNQVDFRDLMALLLNNDQAACSRFDIAGDDYTKNLWRWDDLEAAARDRNFAGPHERQKIDNYEGGVTYYFGTRKSEAFYRFYDKNAESGGAVNANRMELELKRSKAHQAFVAWLQPPAGDEQTAAQILAEFLTGNIDFIDRSEGDKNLDRCPRLAWWQAILDCVAVGVKLSPVRAVPTIERTMTWAEKKVGPSLHMLRRVLGDSFDDWLGAVMSWGADHQNQRHDRMVLAAQLEGW
jgi:hypothetical protein